MKRERIKRLPTVCHSYLYIWITAAIVYLGWYFDYSLPTIAVLMGIIGLVLCFSEDVLPVLPPLWMFYYALSPSKIDLSGQAPWLALIILPFVGIAVNLIRFRKRRASLERKPLRGFDVALIIASVAMVLGGITRGGRNYWAVAAIAALAVVYPFVYILLTKLTYLSKDRILKYVLHLMFVVGILLTAQGVTAYLQLGSWEDISYCIHYKLLKLGWGGCNNLAPTLSIAIPVTFYYSLKKSKFGFLFVILGLLQYALVWVTMSRGAILFDSIFMVVIFIYLMKKSENRISTLVCFILAAVVAAVMLYIMRDKVVYLMQHLVNNKLEPNGREVLYRKAWDLFREYPVFGAGFDYNLGGLKGNGYTPFWYHCTALQVLACMGYVGAAAYLLLAFWRFRTLLTKRTSANLALFLGLLLYDLYAMIDVNYFPPNSFIILLIMTLAAEVNLDDDSGYTIFTVINRKIKAKKALKSYNR